MEKVRQLIPTTIGIWTVHFHDHHSPPLALHNYFATEGHEAASPWFSQASVHERNHKRGRLLEQTTAALNLNTNGTHLLCPLPFWTALILFPPQQVLWLTWWQPKLSFLRGLHSTIIFISGKGCCTCLFTVNMGQGSNRKCPADHLVSTTCIIPCPYNAHNSGKLQSKCPTMGTAYVCSSTTIK